MTARNLSATDKVGERERATHPLYCDFVGKSRYVYTYTYA